jgi:hypothetical protein
LKAAARSSFFNSTHDFCGGFRAVSRGVGRRNV